MIGIDSNILLRLFLADTTVPQDAPGQFALVRKLVTESEEPFFINHIVIVETIWVLKQKLKLSKEAIAATLLRLLRLSNVTVQDTVSVAAALNTFTHHPGDFSDHLIGEINRQNGCRTTLTFDKAASKSPNFSELAR